ncbi:MAG: AAA family ATPase, partial [Patescibacteria group bacterium]
GEVPKNLNNKNIFQIDLSAIVAGATFRGEFEARLKETLAEAEERNAAIFIDEFHTVIGAGAAQGSLDASNIIKPLLSLGKVQIIGATTLAEWRKYVERDGGLARRFQPIMIDEPTESQTEEILLGILPALLNHHQIKIAPEVASAAVKLSNRYITERFLPDKAIDLLDEAGALKALEANLKPRRPAGVGAPTEASELKIENSPRIGVAYAGPIWSKKKWRFTLMS